MTLPDCLPIQPLQVEVNTGLPEFPSAGWRALRDLPPFAFVQIRAMGEMLFSPLTRTSLAWIEVLPLSDQSAPLAQPGQKLPARPLAAGEHLEITCEALPLLGGMP